ncbi:uncharacterized protein [Epargyreus clarus]|uniref:uncharacterized protein n=1 Tax=Epargyreus clarus TaxID=520877 RepID=UPI003C2FEF81
MLYLTLVLAALSCASAKPMTQAEAPLSSVFLDKVLPLIKKCADESQVPTSTFNKLLDGIVENDASLEFMTCYLKGADLIDDDGHIKVNNLVVLIKDDGLKDGVKKAFEHCNESSGKDQKETVRLMVTCYKENSPVVFTSNIKK